MTSKADSAIEEAHRLIQAGAFREAETLLLSAPEMDATVLNLLGVCRLSLGKPLEAENAFRTVIGSQPAAAPALANLGLALRMQNRGDEALECFRRAVDLAPEQPSNYLQLFKQLQQLSRWFDAIVVLEAGVAAHPTSATLREALAAAYGRVGRSEEAERLFQSLANVRPSAANRYADWLEEQGRVDEAAAWLEHSLRLRPEQGEPYRRLAEAGRPGMLERVRGRLRDARLDDASRMHLQYALGRLLDRTGDDAGSVRAYDIANDLAYHAHPACATFDPEWTCREPGVAADLYTRDFLECFGRHGVRGIRPVFIVGMIRSGTTLLDQIVGAHPDVDSTGEGTFWNTEGDAIHARWPAEAPSAAEIQRLGYRYLDSLGRKSESKRFTDKMPLNYRHLGLIRIVFPEAQIVHIRRDPFDTCLSIYTSFFAGGPNFAYNVYNIATFYSAYMEYMAHWRATLDPVGYHEVDYENLIHDPGPTIHRLVEFLGLPWDEACLRPEENPQPVSTPSRLQVRRPIYASSVGKRARYGEFWPAFRDL